MFGYMLFSHIAGLAIWMGALLAIVVMLILLRKSLGTAEMNALAKKVVKVFSVFVYPSSILVLVSGIVMVVQMGFEKGTKPFWLDMMEKGGGTIVMLALVLTAVMGRKLNKRLSNAGGQAVAISGYLSTKIAFLIAIMAIVLIVSLRLT